MLSTVFNFMITIPVENSALRALITVAEILGFGFLLYCFWEVLPRLPQHIARAAKEAGRPASTQGQKVPSDNLG